MGTYSLLLVTQDIRTGVRVVAETMLKVSPAPLANNRTPQFILPSSILHNSITYTTPGSSVVQNWIVEDSDGVEDLSITPLSLLPEGMTISTMEQSSIRG